MGWGPADVCGTPFLHPCRRSFAPLRGTHHGWRVDRHPRQLTDLDGNLTADIVGFGHSATYVQLS